MRRPYALDRITTHDVSADITVTAVAVTTISSSECSAEERTVEFAKIDR